MNCSLAATSRPVADSPWKYAPGAGRTWTDTARSVWTLTSLTRIGVRASGRGSAGELNRWAPRARRLSLRDWRQVPGPGYAAHRTREYIFPFCWNSCHPPYLHVESLQSGNLTRVDGRRSGCIAASVRTVRGFAPPPLPWRQRPCCAGPRRGVLRRCGWAG